MARPRKRKAIHGPTARTTRKEDRPEKNRRRRAAFTLIEVMIAMFIFFVGVFAVLGVVGNALRNARALQRKTVDAGMVAAQISLTNRLDEGMETGDFEDLCPGVFPGLEWTRDTYEVGSNRLFQVDMIVQRNSSGPVESKMSILLWRPDSPPGSMDRGVAR